MGDVDLKISLYEPGNTPQEVTYSPKSWKDTQVKVGRNLVYYGITRDYSNAIAFVEDGAKFLRNLWYTKGRAAKARMKIETRQSYDWLYKGFIETDLTFSKANDEKDTFTIQAMEGGLPAMIKAYEDVEVEIPIDGPEKLTVDIAPMLIQGEIRWLSTFPPSFPSSTSQDPINAQRGGSFYYIKTSSTTFDDTNGPPVNAQTQNYQATPLTGNWLETTYLLSPTKPIYKLVLSGRLDFRIKNESGSPESYTVRISKIPVGSQQASLLQNIALGTLPGNVAVDTTIIFNAQLGDWLPGEKLLFHFTWSGLSGTGSVRWGNNQTMKATFLNYATKFSLDGLRPIEVFRRLVAKITNGAYTAASNLMGNPNASYVDGVDNRPYDMIITSGDAIRGAVTSGSTVPKIKIKLKDFFAATNVWWNTGMTADNGVARIERKDYFFNPAQKIADLLEPVNYSVTDATDYAYNKVNIGYNTYDYDGLNGKDEINTGQVYSGPTLDQNTLDLISPIRCDGYGIFYQWVKYATTESTDSSSDNNVFAIEISPTPNGDGHYSTLKLPGTRGGVIDPDNTLNWGLTPAKCLIRQGSFIRSCFYGYEAESLIYQTTDKNATAYSNLAYGYVKECEDRPISRLRSALFKPFYLTGDFVSPSNLLDELDIVPHGVFNLPLQGKQVSMFCMEAGVKPIAPSVFTFKLLCAPGSDLTQLIK